MIADLEWLPSPHGYILVLVDPDLVMIDEIIDESSILFGVLLDAKATWAAPIEVGESWDRPAVSFNVVLAARSRATLTTAPWKALGASVIGL